MFFMVLHVFKKYIDSICFFLKNIYFLYVYVNNTYRFYILFIKHIESTCFYIDYMCVIYENIWNVHVFIKLYILYVNTYMYMF